MSTASLPIALLPLERPPHLHGGSSPAHIDREFLVALAPVVAAALILFGRAAAVVLCCSMVGAALGEALVLHIAPGGPRRNMLHAVLTGALVALTLPVTVSWHVAFLGGLLALGVGKGLLGGSGNYVWHPALVGRAVLQLLFGAELTPRCWPVLAQGRLWSGSIGATAEAAYYHGHQLNQPPWGVDAWGLQRPIDGALACYSAPLGEGSVSGSGWLSMFRDHLPPWSDTLWGTVGGGIGETCTVALVLGGLYLMYRGLLRWSSAVGALLTVAALAVVLPVRLNGDPAWLPVFSAWDHFPAGVAFVLFHLTGGGLLLACLILAADPMTTPLTTRGHVVFGVGVGVVTMAARWFGLTPGSSYWAILAMNTLVPVIDRLTARRRPYGHPPGSMRLI